MILLSRRYTNADEAETDILRRVADREIITGFGHPVYTIADPRNKVIKEIARVLSVTAGDLQMYNIAARLEEVMWDSKSIQVSTTKK